MNTRNKYGFAKFLEVLLILVLLLSSIIVRKKEITSVTTYANSTNKSTSAVTFSELAYELEKAVFPKDSE